MITIITTVYREKMGKDIFNSRDNLRKKVDQEGSMLIQCVVKCWRKNSQEASLPK